MKKSYVKPQVYFENFQLSANIAGDCKDIQVDHDQFTCTYVISGVPTGPYFTDANNNCSSKPNEEGMCVQVHATMFFAS